MYDACILCCVALRLLGIHVLFNDVDEKHETSHCWRFYQMITASGGNATKQVFIELDVKSGLVDHRHKVDEAVSCS